MQKLSLLSIIIISILSFTSLKAQTKADIFNTSTPITWLGVDFSEMKFIGTAAGWGGESTKSSSEMRDTYFHVWNEVIEKESKNFKLEAAVNRNAVEWNGGAVKKVNSKANKKEIFTESASEYQNISESDLSKMVKQYDFNGNTGIGFTLIAEGMNKNLEEASYWATFIDMKSKKVLLAKRITGSAQGFGFRNYWLGTIKSVFKKMKKEFKTWD